MEKIQFGSKVWVQEAQKAADQGRTRDAIFAMSVLLDFCLNGIATAVNNQFDLHAAIAQAANNKNGQNKP